MLRSTFKKCHYKPQSRPIISRIYAKTWLKMFLNIISVEQYNIVKAINYVVNLNKIIFVKKFRQIDLRNLIVDADIKFQKTQFVPLIHYK